MRRLRTKADREAVQKASIEHAIKTGWKLEEYKTLKILTSDRNNLIMLKIFSGSSSNHLIYRRYRTEEARQTEINNVKNNHDTHEKYKAEKRAKKEKSSTAQTAEAIRKDLKESFPGIKFKVKSSIFSMGDSVHINWFNGPSTKFVEEIVNKYQYGHFNSMEDMYENSNSRKDIPQAKYVQTSREETEELKSVLHQFVEDLKEDPKCNWDNFEIERLRWPLFSKTSFPAGADNFKIKRSDKDSGLMEDLYTISYDQPKQKNQPKKEQNFEKVEVKEGEINIIQYSEKSIAVVGDTKPIKEDLKKLGGRFNFRLSCGAGWIFQMSKLEEVQNFLTEYTAKGTKAKEELKEEINKTVQFFAETDKEIYGEVQEATKQIAEVQEVEIIEVQEEEEEEEVKQHDSIESITKAAQQGEQISLFNLSQLL